MKHRMKRQLGADVTWACGKRIRNSEGFAQSEFLSFFINCVCYMASNERALKEAVVAYFNVLFQQLSGGTEENHQNSQSEQMFSGSRSEPGFSRVRSRSTNCSTAKME